MPSLSFFLKYSDYRRGLRFVIKDGSWFSILYNRKREPEDEFFDGTFDSMMQLQTRLKEHFGAERGERWFTHLFQQLFRYHMRQTRKKRKHS
jgi:hypothetical protein